MFSSETNRIKGKNSPSNKDENIDQKTNNFSSVSTHPITAAALRRGEWSRAGSEGRISGPRIDASVGSIDAHENICHTQHLTSTPLRSLADNNSSKILEPKMRGRMYSPSITPIPTKPEEKGDIQISTSKKISQGSDCQSFADSGIACDRKDSFEFDITGDTFSKEGYRAQSIDLLSEDLLSSTSDDAAHAELVSFSPPPTLSSTPSPSCPASQRHDNLKPAVGKKFLNIKNPSLYDRMFGSDNGINVDPKTKEGSVDSKELSGVRPKLRSRSAERCLQRNRGTGNSIIPGVKQSTLKLISMKTSQPPPPKPLFLVPKQPNPPSSPVPPSFNPSGTVSSLLYYERNQENDGFEGTDKINKCTEYGKDESESDGEQFDVECQVHPRKKRPSSTSHASLPTTATTFNRNQSIFTLKKSTSIPVQLTVTSNTSAELPESLRPPCCDRVASIIENIAATPSMANRSFAISTSTKDHDPYCEKLIGLNDKRWNSSNSINNQQPNIRSRAKPRSYGSTSAIISKRRIAATLGNKAYSSRPNSRSRISNSMSSEISQESTATKSNVTEENIDGTNSQITTSVSQFPRSKSQHQLGRQTNDGGLNNRGNGYSTLPRRLHENRPTQSQQRVPRSSSATRAYSSRQSTPQTKVNNKVPPPPEQPTLSSLMRSSKSVNSGLSKMTLNCSTSRPRLLSSTLSSISITSRCNVSPEEVSKDGDRQRHYSKESSNENQIYAKADGARPKTPGGTRRPNTLKQGKILNTSMEIWEIQKNLKRGEMVQGMLQLGPPKCTFGSGRESEPRICAPVMLGRSSGHMDWRSM